MLISTHVAIIGAGFSGTMLAVNLIKNLPAHRNISLTLIEKSGRFAQGAAYSTTDPSHLLNVPAILMGAFWNDPKHFFRWIQSHKQIWEAHFHDLVVHEGSFVPRQLYALYLNFLFEQAKLEAEDRQIKLRCIPEEAIEALPRNPQHIQIRLKNGLCIEANVVVLATNLSTYKRFEVDPDLPKQAYIANLWDPTLHEEKFAYMHNPQARIVIIGTGLTMVDATVSLIKRGFSGQIIALSKDGCMPEPHIERLEQIPSPFTVQDAPRNMLTLFRRIRTEIKNGEKFGINWRQIIDSLRPITVGVWEQLPLKEKKQFVRHILSQWNRYRHRIPPESHRILQNFLKKEKLSFQSGYVTAIRKANPLQVRIISTPNDDLIVDCVINCSGPQLDINKTNSLLFKSLLSQSLITSDPLNMGIVVDEQYRVIGENEEQILPIYAMGQLLYGQKLETVAIPELREQCHSIALHLSSKCS